MTRRLIALPLVLVGLLLVSRPACAQAEKAKAPQSSAETSTSAKEPDFRASLLVIKSDWTKAPAAKEIYADLRQAFGQEGASLKQLSESPPTAAWLLFSTSAGSIYSQDHYRQLLAWLQAHQLVESNELFGMSNRGSAEKPFFTASLKKDGEYFGILTRGKDEPFFTRKSEFTWSVMPSTIMQTPGFFIDRQLVDYEQARGEDQPHPANPNEYDSCNYGITSLDEGQALIVHAFPGTEHDGYLESAQRKGLLALVVVEQRPFESKGSSEAKLLLPDKVVRIKTNRMRGTRASSGPVGGPPPAGPTGSKARSLIAKDLMLSWSEAKDVAWGYSKSLGKWAEQKMDPPATDTPPVAGDNLAVWSVGSVYYAFSGDAGRWDVLRLPENHTPYPVIDTDFARVHDGDDVYTFAAATGRWSSPKDSQSASQNEAGESPIKVYQLRNIKARAAERIIRDLLGERLGSMAVDERTNSLIISAPRRAARAEADELFNIIMALLVRLDGPTENAATSTTTKGTPTPAAELKGRYQAQEEAVEALAAKIRELQAASPPDKAQLEKLLPQLRRAVADAFAARQALHQAEAAELQLRVAAIQQNLQARQKIGEKIIEHRVQELLNPNLQWDHRSGPTVGTAASTSPSPSKAPLTRLPGEAPQATSDLANASVAAKRTYRDKLRERWIEIEQLHRSSKFPLADLLSSANDLAQAELAASLNTDERRVARQAQVSRLKEIKSLIDAKFEAGVLPHEAQLAVDAALLWAESELAAEADAKAADQSNPRSSSAALNPAASSPVTLSIGRSGETTTLRSPDDFRNQLRNLEDILQLAEQTDVSKFAGVTQEERAQDKQRIVEARRRDLMFLREEYTAQLRLLELEIQDAYAALHSTEQQRTVAKRLYDSGESPIDAVLSYDRSIQESKHRVERARTLLGLYLKADPKNSTSPPSAEPKSTTPAAP